MNQQYITREILEAMGIGLPVGEEEQFVAHVNETLAQRIGDDIAESLDDDQLDEMLAIQKTGDTVKLTEWLSANVPDLSEIANNERDILLGEIADNADAVLAAK